MFNQWKCNLLKREGRRLCNRPSSVFSPVMRRGSVTAHAERKSDPLKWEKLLTEQHNSVSLGSIRANLSIQPHSHTSNVTEKLRCGILNYLFSSTSAQIYSERSEILPGSKKRSAKKCVTSAFRVFNINNDEYDLDYIIIFSSNIYHCLCIYSVGQNYWSPFY